MMKYSYLKTVPKRSIQLVYHYFVIVENKAPQQ